MSFITSPEFLIGVIVGNAVMFILLVATEWKSS